MLTRKISKKEFQAVVDGKIPAFDAVFDFDKYGKAVVVHDQKYGVITKDYEILLDEIYDKVEILKNGCIIAKYEDAYLLFDKQGYLVRTKGFATRQEAKEYSEFF